MTSKEKKLVEFNPNDLATGGKLFGLPFNEKESDLVIIPVPWEATVSYRSGTAQGPLAVLEASAQVDLYDYFNPDGWKHGFYLLEQDEDLLELGRATRILAEKYLSSLGQGELKLKTLEKVNQACSQMVKKVERTALSWLEQGKFVALLGGDHSIPLGFLQALATKHQGFGILQIDAHLDLRKAYEGFLFSHASIMYNALKIEAVTKLVQVGIRDYCLEELQVVEQEHVRIKVFYDQNIKRSQLEGTNWSDICEQIINELPSKVYISFDIDGLQPWLCPNTGTPVPGGLEWEQVLMLLERVVDSGRKIIGFDLNEVSPGLNGDWDAAVGARLLFRLCNIVMKSQNSMV